MTIFKNIFKDLKVLKWYEKTFLLLSGVFLVCSSFFDFNNHFTPFIGSETPVYEMVFQIVAGVAAFTGILCVFMVGKGKMSNYFWGIICVTTYGLYAFSVGYTGDAMLNLLFFLPFQFIGICTWRKNLNKTQTVNPKKFTWKDFLLYLVVGFGLSVGFYFLIPVVDEALNRGLLQDNEYVYPFEDNELAHTFDAWTNGFSITAQILMLLRFKNQWYVWIFVNILQIAMYSGINGWGVDPSMILMWTCFLINAVYSLGNWVLLEHEKTQKRTKEYVLVLFVVNKAQKVKQLLTNTKKQG